MDRKLTGIVAYLTFVGWILAYVAGDQQGARFHLNQALVINLASLVISLVRVLFGWIPFLGWILSLTLGLISLVLLVVWVIGLVYALQDQEKPVPLLGGIKILN